VAEYRQERLLWLKRNNYMQNLAKLGCFEQGTQMTPETFANVVADLERVLKCLDAERKFPKAE
jgi:hypothetical protein